MLPSLNRSVSLTPLSLPLKKKLFYKELDQMRADVEAGVIHKPMREPKNEGTSGLVLNDYPDL
ncbi:hypothetical protein [Pseudomonas fluorescens]|uniref:hypothetical protein n=1 Tax=Pseudomonas fluorescens TaxID=294 RepID=UPI0015EC3896|nr:hypothetical protein [Pseudomonas fluorescens]